MYFFGDSGHVFHVAKTGNDGNGGVAQQYPVSLANDAFLTIGAAVSAASNGDTIVVWPGTYAEVVDLTGKTGVRLVGTGWGTVISTSNNDRIVDMGAYCTIENIKIVNSQAAGGASNGISAIEVDNQDGVRILNCRIEGTNNTGIYINDSDDIIVGGCSVKGAEYGIYVIDSMGSFVKDCRVETAGWTTCDSGGITCVKSRMQIENCIVMPYMTTGSSGHWSVGIKVIAFFASSSYCTVLNSTILPSTGNDEYIKGFEVLNGATPGIARVFISGSYVRCIGTGTSNVYDLEAGSYGSITIAGCSYRNDKVTGNVIFRPASDSNGRVDIGAVDGDANGAGRLNKANKMLVNKAIQNKTTGAVDYYDDDGETLILTHTPSDSESIITRTAS